MMKCLCGFWYLFELILPCLTLSLIDSEYFIQTPVTSLGGNTSIFMTRSKLNCFSRCLRKEPCVGIRYRVSAIPGSSGGVCEVLIQPVGVGVGSILVYLVKKQGYPDGRFRFSCYLDATKILQTLLKAKHKS